VADDPGTSGQPGLGAPLLDGVGERNVGGPYEVAEGSARHSALGSTL